MTWSSVLITPSQQTLPLFTILSKGSHGNQKLPSTTRESKSSFAVSQRPKVDKREFSRLWRPTRYNRFRSLRLPRRRRIRWYSVTYCPGIWLFLIRPYYEHLEYVNVWYFEIKTFDYSYDVRIVLLPSFYPNHPYSCQSSIKIPSKASSFTTKTIKFKPCIPFDIPLETSACSESSNHHLFY